MNLFAAMTLAAIVAVAAAAPVVSRYILTFTGPVSAWHVERGTQRLTPKNGLPLQPGDCVTLDGAGGAAMTLVVDGREIAIAAKSPHYCVSDQGAQNPVVAAIARSFASFAGVFHGAESDYDAQTTTAAVSRGVSGPHVAFPMLVLNDQRIVEGRRALALSWAGGAPPYAVSVVAEGASGPLTSAQAAAKHVRLPVASFAPGTYLVHIKDTSGLRGEARFTVVPASALPAQPADVATILADPGTPADVRAAYAAAWLMADPSDTWRLEAYQRVVGHEGSELARRLIYQLENGG
jgi:hypothetical protein